jgi:glycyl-tRNA synthetase beta chain
VVGEAAGKVVQDEWLVDWIANSTEWPRPMLGNFDDRFLHLPREILITVMRDHQRYFAVEDGQGNLRPNFVAVLNMDSDEKGLIRQGHQRVLTARFRDAEFFWAADQKVPLRSRVPLLDKVTYQAKLGSYGDKILRMKAIAGNICVELEDNGLMTPGQTLEVLRAVELCKCDLTTQMVQEFTELQGIVGGLYAKAQGEPEEISTAIYDHYLPMGAEGASPRTLVGAMVSLADKVDSVVAGFAAGHEPTGSSDPFALRRQANGIVKVILENWLPLNIKEAVNKAFNVLDIQWNKPREVMRARVMEFFAERLRYYFESVRGFRYDTVRAVLAAGADHPADAQARAEAMEALRGGEDFEALSAAAKRIRNILAKSATAADWQAGEVMPDLLIEPQERDLYEAYGRVALEVASRCGGREYRRALEEISTLRPAVDRFFDKVLVMAEDSKVRQNRLRLLKKLDELFSGIAHFAEIEGQ